ncbi:MAG: hypothetical protein HYR94_26595, partial [Chloroflexi bacterium]|nr:hypothetical protein [Chloroflexota bacterium]
MSTELETTLPKLYASWMAELLDGPIPAETNATCLNCAMLAPPGEPVNGSTLYYHPQTKCCTYIPQIPNFLVGCILSDDNPALAKGRASLITRIQAGSATTPLWLERSPTYDLKYNSRDHFFGRMTGLHCPHYLEEDGGLCGIWRYREAICPTLGLEQEETHLRLKTQREVWGRWHGREPEFFAACARLVESLRWAEVAAIAGPELRLRAGLLAARDEMDDGLGVHRGLEQAAASDQLAAQLVGVG